MGRFKVIINANGDSGGGWAGDVEIDTDLLSPIPNYEQTGLIGAVGQVPFAVHQDDCEPPSGGMAAANAFSVVLKFYGPITSSGVLPVNI